MKTIVCYGDSNTWGHHPKDGSRIPYAERWTGALQTLLGEEYLVYEEGMNARTTVFDDPVYPCRNGLYYLKPCLYTKMPVDLLIIMLGTNDVKGYLGQTPFSISQGIGRLIEAAQEGGFGPNEQSPEILITAPVKIGEKIGETWLGDQFDDTAWEKASALAPLYRKIAGLYGCHFMDASKYAAPSPIDQLHLDSENHGKLARAFYEQVKEILG